MGMMRAQDKTCFGPARNHDTSLVLSQRLRGGSDLRPGLGDDVEAEFVSKLLQSAPENTCRRLDLEKKARELGRLVTLISPEMADRITGLSPDESAALVNDFHDPIAGVIVPMLGAHSLSKLSQGRLALLNLFDFAMARGLHLIDFECSVGFLLAFLGSQKTKSGAQSRRLGLIWAQTVLKVAINALSPVLEKFKCGNATGTRTVKGSALITPFVLLMHFAKIAADTTNPPYVCAAAAVFLLMCLGSLRYSDVCRNVKVPCLNNAEGGWAIAGCSEDIKGKSGLTYWWADAKCPFGSMEWIHSLTEPLQEIDPSPDYIFRRGVFEKGKEGQPEHFLRWGDGPAPKPHFILAFLHICSMHPLNWTAEFAKQYVRLHGFRRVYPCIARLLSKQLKMSIDDRQELGRWANSAIAGEAKQNVVAPLANKYASEAARFKLVSTRNKVGDAIRKFVSELRRAKEHWYDLPVEGGGYEVLLSDEPTIQEDEPQWADSDDSDDEFLPARLNLQEPVVYRTKGSVQLAVRQLGSSSTS